MKGGEGKGEWWVYGGIYGGVWVEVVGEVEIEEFVVNGEEDGKFEG